MTENEVTIEIEGSPDSQGRQHFTAFWLGWDLETNLPAIRAQVFHSVLARHLEYWEKKGKTVTVKP